MHYLTVCIMNIINSCWGLLNLKISWSSTRFETVVSGSICQLASLTIKHHMLCFHLYECQITEDILGFHGSVTFIYRNKENIVVNP